MRSLLAFPPAPAPTLGYRPIVSEIPGHRDVPSASLRIALSFWPPAFGLPLEAHGVGRDAGKCWEVAVRVGHSHHCLVLLQKDELVQPRY